MFSLPDYMSEWKFLVILGVRLEALDQNLLFHLRTSVQTSGDTYRTEQTFPGVALSCQSNLSKPEYDSSMEFPLTGREFMDEQRKWEFLCSWDLLDSLKPVGRWRTVQTVEDNRRKVFKKRNKQCNIAKGFVRMGHIVEHLIARQNTMMMSVKG